MLADNIRPEYYRSKHRSLPNGFSASRNHDDPTRTFNSGLNALTCLPEFSRKITVPSGGMIVESLAFSQSLVGKPFFSMGSATDTLLLGSPEPPTSAVFDIKDYETEMASEAELAMEMTTNSTSPMKKKKSKGTLKALQTDLKPGSNTVSPILGSETDTQGRDPKGSKSKRRRQRRRKKTEQSKEENVSASIEEKLEEIKEVKEKSTEDALAISEEITESSKSENSKEAEKIEETDPELERLRRKYCFNYAYDIPSEQEDEGEFKEVVAKKRHRGVRINALKQPNSPINQEDCEDRSGHSGRSTFNQPVSNHPTQAESNGIQKPWRPSARPDQGPPPNAGFSKPSGKVQLPMHTPVSSGHINSSKSAYVGPPKQLGQSYVSNKPSEGSTITILPTTSNYQRPAVSKESHLSDPSKTSAWPKPLYPKTVSSNIYSSAPKESVESTHSGPLTDLKTRISGKQPPSATESSTFTDPSKTSLPTTLASSKVSGQPVGGESSKISGSEVRNPLSPKIQVSTVNLSKYQDSFSPPVTKPAAPKISVQLARGRTKSNCSELPRPSDSQTPISDDQRPSTSGSLKPPDLSESTLQKPPVSKVSDQPPLKVPSVSTAREYPEPSIKASSRMPMQSSSSVTSGQPKCTFTRSDAKPVSGIVSPPKSNQFDPFRPKKLRGRRRAGFSSQLSTCPKMSADSHYHRSVETSGLVRSQICEAQSQAEQSEPNFPTSSKKPCSLPHPYLPGGQVEGYVCEMSNIPCNLWVPPELSRQLVPLDKYMRSEWEEFQRMRERAGKKCE